MRESRRETPLARQRLTSAVRRASALQGIADGIGLALAAALAGLAAPHLTIWAVALAAVTLIVMTHRDAYAQRLESSVFDVVLRDVLPSTVIATAVVVTARSLLETNPHALDQVVHVTAWCAGMLTLTHGGGTLLMRRARRHGIGVDRVLILGSGHVGRRLAHRLSARKDLGLEPVGYLDDDLAPVTLGPGREDLRLPVLGRLQDLGDVAGAQQIDAVIVAFSRQSDADIAGVVNEARQLGLSVHAVPRLFDTVSVRTARRRIGTMPIDELISIDPRGKSFRLKYAIDRVIASIAVALVSPVLVAIAVLVKISSPGPVLFRQRRVGLDGHEFDIFKFRSMRLPDRDEEFVLREGSAPGGVEGEDRRTTIGKFIRRTNLDELPQLINIARGDMSIVGPRPERPEFVELFSKQFGGYDARHRVKAGLTGWAQVNGLRGQTSILERAEWDNYYIENWSLWFDAMIVCRTIKTFFEKNE